MRNVLVAALAALTLAGVAASSAGAVAASDLARCGGVKTGMPKGVKDAPLAIGDSTMLLAIPHLVRLGYAVNAQGCRQWFEANDVLRQLRRAGKLPSLIVIALGADGAITRKHISTTLAIIGRDRRLVLATQMELGGVEGSDTRLVRRTPDLYPGRINVLDWARYSRGHGGWFQPDGIHMTFGGAEQFAKYLAHAKPLADSTPTAFGTVSVSKPGMRVRFSATLRLVPRKDWSVTARRTASGAPEFKIRRRGKCASVVTLRGKAARSRARAGAGTRLATLADPVELRSGLPQKLAGGAAAAWWRNASGALSGAWVLPLGDPFGGDKDADERAFLEVTATGRPVGSTRRACVDATLQQALKSVRRLPA